MGHLQTRKTRTPFPNKDPFPNKEPLSKQGETFPNKEKHQQTRETPFEQGKRLSSKGYLPIKCKSLQVVGVSGQGKAVVSDVGVDIVYRYGGMRRKPRETGGGDGVGSAPLVVRPCFPLAVV